MHGRVILVPNHTQPTIASTTTPRGWAAGAGGKTNAAHEIVRSSATITFVPKRLGAGGTELVRQLGSSAFTASTSPMHAPATRSRIDNSGRMLSLPTDAPKARDNGELLRAAELIY